MRLQLSPVVRATQSDRGGNFSVHRPDTDALARHIAPILGFDHYRMGGPTFPPHPHAGFSVVTYVLEDSKGSVRNRDSLGHDLLIQPGGLLWTQASRGLVHDEVPAEPGRPVHGLQLFVNLKRQNKHRAPEVFHVQPDAVPTVEDAAGNRVRVLTGTLGATASIAPTEAFDLYDARLRASWTYPLKPERNLMVYVLSGALEVRADGQQRRLEAHDALGVRGMREAASVELSPVGEAQVLLLSGTDPEEPVAAAGPFIMNTEAELQQAFERYRKGEMGHLMSAAA